MDFFILSIKRSSCSCKQARNERVINNTNRLKRKQTTPKVKES